MTTTSDIPEEAPRPSIIRRTLKITGKCVLLIALIFVNLLLFRYLGTRWYVSSRAEEEWTVWSRQWPEVPDAQNRWAAYARIRKHFESTGPSEHDWWSGKLLRVPELGDDLPEGPSPLRDILTQYDPILNDLVAATRLAEYSIPAREARGSFGVFGATCVPLNRLLGRFLAYRGWLRLHHGGADEGVADLRALSKYAADLTQGGDAFSVLYALSLNEFLHQALHHELFREGMTAGRCRKLAGQLTRDLARYPTAEDIQRVNRLATLDLFDSGKSPYGDWGEFRPDTVYLVLSVPAYDEAMSQVISLQSLPYHEWHDQSLARWNEIVAQHHPVWFWQQASVWALVPQSLGIRTSLENEKGKVSVLIAALRARAMFLDTGAYPASFEELERHDGQAVLRNPVTGEALDFLLEDGLLRIQYPTAAAPNPWVAPDQDPVFRLTLPGPTAFLTPDPEQDFALVVDATAPGMEPTQTTIVVRGDHAIEIPSEAEVDAIYYPRDFLWLERKSGIVFGGNEWRKWSLATRNKGMTEIGQIEDQEVRRLGYALLNPQFAMIDEGNEFVARNEYVMYRVTPLELPADRLERASALLRLQAWRNAMVLPSKLPPFPLVALYDLLEEAEVFPGRVWMHLKAGKTDQTYEAVIRIREVTAEDLKKVAGTARRYPNKPPARLIPR